MKRSAVDIISTLDEDEGLPSPYDGSTAEEDLWFLPPPPEEAAWEIPGPRADRAVRPEAGGWARAEAGQGRGLVRAAAAFARLDERLRRSPHRDGWVQRLALAEAEALARVSGDLLPTGALALAEALRGGGTEEDTRRLRAARWAYRRLVAGSPPAPGALAAFLGLHRVGTPGLGDLAPRPEGPEFALAAAEWETVTDAPALHPLTRAALAHAAWRAIGLSTPGDMIEGGVAAALIGAEEARGGLPFLPVASGGGIAHRAGGPEDARLAAWYEGIELACLAGLLACDRVETWQVRAAHATRDLSGRSVAGLLQALAAAPLVSAEAAAMVAGCSRSAAERNLALLEGRGVAVEVTGQRRFRLWRAAL